MSVRSLLRAATAVLTVTVLGLGAVGCSRSVSSAPEVTEVVTVTGTAASAAAPASSAAAVPAALKSSYKKFSRGLAQPVGVSIMAVGGGPVISLGDQAPRVAWSTIKVPLALAAQRKNGITAAETGAIVDSDNAAAESLWVSLGSSQEAAQAVTAVLAEGGDVTTTVPSQRERAEFSIFGQTVWTLDDAVRFTAHLPCLPDSAHVVQLMGRVAGNQEWGIDTISTGSTAVKGGWGPGMSGGYVVRQIGLLTRPDGAQIAFAISTYAADASMEGGITALNQVGSWIGENLDSMPGGNC